MNERWVGVTVSSDKVILVDAEVEADQPLIIQSDESWKVQKGDRARAYAVTTSVLSIIEGQQDCEGGG